jgi:type IX secretion system PorP/SprF family membrane protein
MTSLMKTHRKLLFIALATVAISANAQQTSLFTQYMFNGLVINPAYTGTHGNMTATAAYRSQWTRLKGAPQTQVASLHSPIKFSRSSAGALLTHDQAGVTHQYTLYGTYAYYIPVSAKGKISVGGQVGMSYYQSNRTDANIVTNGNQPDPTYMTNDSRFMPNLGVGAYYYTKRTYVGLSVPTIINNKWNHGDLNGARQARHYFLSAGHVMDIAAHVKFKPNVLLKWEEGGPFQYDLNANFLFAEVLWVGVSYRMKDSVDGLLEFVINNQMHVGYSYGFPINALATTQSGTHEFVLNYRIKRNKNIVFSPRYF